MHLSQTEETYDQTVMHRMLVVYSVDRGLHGWGQKSLNSFHTGIVCMCVCECTNLVLCSFTVWSRSILVEGLHLIVRTVCIHTLLVHIPLMVCHVWTWTFEGEGSTERSSFGLKLTYFVLSLKKLVLVKDGDIKQKQIVTGQWNQFTLSLCLIISPSSMACSRTYKVVTPLPVGCININ